LKKKAEAKRHSRPLWGARYPSPSSDEIYFALRGSKRKRSSYYRSAASTTNTAPLAHVPNTAFRDITDSSQIYVLQDPYRNRDKARFEDAYRSDPIVRRCTNVFAKFVLGSRTKTVIDIRDEFVTQEKQQKALASAADLTKKPTTDLKPAMYNNNAAVTSLLDQQDKQLVQDAKQEAILATGIISRSELDDLKTYIDRINRRVRFHERVKAAMIQSFVGGRAALLVERDQATGGEPTDLKILNWKKLEDVYADIDSWQFLGVGYADREKDDPLRAEEIIYLTNFDFHISPDTLYYGLSQIEPIAHISEANRLIDEEDLKEANRTLWAQHGLIKFPPTVSAEKMDEFIENFYPGTWNATSEDVTVESHAIDIDLESLVVERNENDRRILRSFGVPAFLMGFEEITNRATSEQVLNAWRESELSDVRTWLQDQLEPQYFDSLIKIRFPDLDLEELELKAKLEFQDITFEPLKDKAEAVVGLYQAGIIDLGKALEVLDMSDILEKMLLEKQRKQELAQAIAQGQQEQQDQQQQQAAGRRPPLLPRSPFQGQQEQQQ
jgi:hypothetical protein